MKKRLNPGILLVSTGMISLAALTSSCQTVGEGAALGAVGGAIAGGVIGNQSGEAGEGAALGALGGAALGGLIGNENQKRRAAYQRGYAPPYRAYPDYRDPRYEPGAYY